MVFKIGDVVEVCSQEKGFKGSYFEAEVVSKVSNCRYKVKYKNLMKDEDKSQPLIEIIAAGDLRPLPPDSSSDDLSYKIREIVDAFYDDGWWIGVIVERNGEMYGVEHPTIGEMRQYGIGKVRKHRSWVAGLWFPP